MNVLGLEFESIGKLYRHRINTGRDNFLYIYIGVDLKVNGEDRFCGFLQTELNQPDEILDSSSVYTWKVTYAQQSYENVIIDIVQFMRQNKFDGFENFSDNIKDLTTIKDILE